MPKKRTCPKCGGSEFKRCSRTYPLVLPGRQINVGRVKVFECQSCLHLIPTPEGEDKLARCLEVFGEMLDQAEK
jgi:YgiT-type zinc finger domain-containing protein